MDLQIPCSALRKEEPGKTIVLLTQTDNSQIRTAKSETREWISLMTWKKWIHASRTAKRGLWKEEAFKMTLRKQKMLHAHA